MSIFDVTSQTSYATVSAAILAAAPGDVIQLSPGTYSENFPKIHDLTIEGVGGMAYLTPALTVNPQPGDPVYQMPSNGQGVLVTEGATVLDHLDISGAVVPDGNGAGVRYETGSLMISNSHIHGNQDGLLANPNAGADIWIDSSEFDHNGAEDGQTHNIYVNQIGTLTITNSYFHDALGGHEIKSRAANTIITNTRIQDGPTSDSNYAVDLPEGGIALIAHDVIEKGASDANWFVIHFGGEIGPATPDWSLSITGLTVVNHYPPPNAEQGFVFDQAVLPSGVLVEPTITYSIFFGFTAPQLLAGADVNGTLVPGSDFGPTNSFAGLDSAPALDTSSQFDVPAPGLSLVAFAALAIARFRKRRAS